MRIQIVLCVILLAGLACKSGKKSGTKKSGAPQYKIHAVDGGVELVHDVVPRAEITVPAVETLIPGGILKRPPLTLSDLKQLPLLGELGGPLGWGATTRWTGQGFLRELQAEDGAARAHRLVLRLVLDYDDTEGLKADYPQLDEKLVEGLPRTEKGRIRFIPVEVRLYLLASDDGKAFRIVLDSLVVYEGAVSVARRGKTTEKPMPALTSVSYTYPDPQHRTLRFTSVIFDHKIVAEEGVYRGHQQSSGWLPLQPEPMTGPFALRVRVAEVTEVARHWLEGVTQHAKPLTDIYKSLK